jgi:hypothetical protein
MAKIRQLRHNFSAGYVDPSFLLRSDSSEFQNACEELVNFELTLSGGVRRRPGGLVWRDTNVGHRLIPWEFDSGQRYLVDLNTDNIRIYSVDFGTSWTLASPFTNVTQIQECDYEQVLNTMIITHQAFPQQVIKGPPPFSIAPIAYTTNAAGAPLMPYARFPADAKVWMSPSAETGAAIMTTETLAGSTVLEWLYYWRADHVGQWFTYENTIFRVDSLIDEHPADPLFGTVYSRANVTIFGSVDTLQLLRLFPAEDYRKFAIGDVLTGADTAATAEVVGFADDEVVQQSWEDGQGNTNTWFTSWPGLIVRPVTGTLKAPSQSLSGQAPAAATEAVSSGATSSRTNSLEQRSGADGRSLNWREQAWSAHRGYPGAVAVHGGRLWFGGSTSRPNFVWASKAQDFFSFDFGQGFPDDAIAAPITGSMMQRVRYFSPGPNLEIMTDQAEYFVPGYQGNPVTPESFTVRPSTMHGVLKGAKPVRMAYATLFVDRSGAALYRQYYDDQSRSVTADLVSGAATSVVRSPKQLARQRGRKAEGQEVLWMVNDDGTATQFRWWPVTGGAAFSLMKRDDGSAWRSMCYVDELRFSIVELPGGARIIERSDDACLLDQHSLLTAMAGQLVWTVPARFPPASKVHVLTDRDADGNVAPGPVHYLGEFTVDALNQITLDTSDYARIYVGTVAEARLKPTPIDFVPMDGDTRMIPKKVVSYAFSLLDTYHVQVENRSLWARQATEGGTFMVPINNEDVRHWQLGYGVRRAPRVVSAVPLPVTLLGFSAEVEI